MIKQSQPSLWGVPVAIRDVSETGRHVNMIADDSIRAAIAKAAGLRSIASLEAHFDVTRHGRDGLRVVGNVMATVEQTCVVTLDPVENAVDERVDLIFAPDPAPLIVADDAGPKVDMATDNTPEPLVNGTVDLGAIATEFLILGLDPYPRKPDAVFEPQKSGDDTGHPFAALAALKKKPPDVH
jgi:uncharacterized metal-binding protein YceD (DUF177 family)